MKRALLALALVAAATSPAFAQLDLAKSKNCLACHAVDKKVVGPAYKLKSLFRDVSNGHLRVYGRLRKGDELWDVFDEFEKMILKLRANQRGEIDRLDKVIAQAKEANTPAGVVAELEELRARMEAEIAE